MKQIHNNIDRQDWDARASEALENAKKKLPPGSKRIQSIRLRLAADMKDLLEMRQRVASLSQQHQQQE